MERMNRHIEMHRACEDELTHATLSFWHFCRYPIKRSLKVSTTVPLALQFRTRFYSFVWSNSQKPSIDSAYGNIFDGSFSTTNSQKFSEAAQDYVRLIFTDYDQDIIKLRFFLAFDTAEVNSNVIVSSNESKDIEPSRKTDKGLFHLILVLRLLDITMFHETNGARASANTVKIPKQLTLKNTTDLMASPCSTSPNKTNRNH